MTLLDKYLGRAVLAGTLLALLLLVSIATLMDFVDEMDNVEKHGYTYLRATFYILLTIPQRIYEFFPSAILLGALLSLGNMAANRELVVLQAAGISVLRIIITTLKAGLLMTLVAILLGEFIAPVSEQKAQSLRKLTKSQTIRLDSRDGLWAKDGDRFLNVRDVFPDMRLGKIRIYQLNDEGRLTKFTSAKSAVYEGDEWLVTNVVHRQIKPEGITTKEAQKERWKRLISPDLFDVITVKPKQMSASKLHRYIKYLDQNGLDSSRYALEFWTRFTIPLSGIVMLLFAMPFVFGPLRSGGAGQRLFVGIMIAVIFHLINQALNKLGLVYGVPPFMAAIFPILLFLTLSFVALRKVA